MLSNPFIFSAPDTSTWDGNEKSFPLQVNSSCQRGPAMLLSPLFVVFCAGFGHRDQVFMVSLSRLYYVLRISGVSVLGKVSVG
jgi:hypothetical protein